MDFQLSEDQLMFQKMFADFCTNEIRPHGEHLDQTEEPPVDLLDKAVDQGFWAALVPEELDGAGLDAYTYMLMLEELSRADMSTALILSVHNSLMVKPLLDHGTDDQKDRYLEALAFGEMLGAFALTEPGAGSDAASVAATATRNGDKYLLNGSKAWVTNGALAGLILVLARAQGPVLGAAEGPALSHALSEVEGEAEGPGEGGITAFLVERETPGLKIGYREKTLGLRAVPCNTLYFSDAPVPAANRLGKEGEGLKIALRALGLSRLGMGAVALGAAERALEEAVQFSIEHIQFGVPIAQKQAIQNYIADAKVKIEALRCLVTHAAWLADSGQDFATQASIAKLFGARAAYEITHDLLQVHGGYGYMKEYAIERYYRDCRALEIIEGTSQIQQFLIARDIYSSQGLDIRP